jgi:hypothetical protein
MMEFDASHYSVDSEGKVYGHADTNLQDFVPEIPGDSSHSLGHLSFGGLLNPIPGDVVQMARDVAESWQIHNSSPESYELNSFAHVWMSAYMSYKYGDGSPYLTGFAKELLSFWKLNSLDTLTDRANNVLGVKLRNYAKANGFALSDLPRLAKEMVNGAGIDLDGDGIKERAINTPSDAIERAEGILQSNPDIIQQIKNSVDNAGSSLGEILKGINNNTDVVNVDVNQTNNNLDVNVNVLGTASWDDLKQFGSDFHKFIQHNNSPNLDDMDFTPVNVNTTLLIGQVEYKVVANDLSAEYGIDQTVLDANNPW